MVTRPKIGGANRAAQSAVGTAVGAPSFRGTQALGQGIAAVGEAVHNTNVKRDRVKAVEAAGEYKRRVLEGEQELDPMAEDYLSQAEELYSSTREAVMEENSFATREGREHMEAQLATLGEGYHTQALSTQQQAVADNAIRVRGQEVDRTLAAIRQDPDGAEAYLEEFSANMAQLGDAIPEGQREQLAEQFADAALLAEIEGLAEAGRHDTARAMLDENAGQLSQDMFRTTGGRLREIKSTQENARLADTQGAVADMNIRIIEATSASELSSLRQEVDAAAERGLFEGRENARVSLIRQIESRRRSIVTATRDQANVLAKLNSGTGLDSQKEADMGWALRTADVEFSNADAKIRTAVDYAAETGFMPTEQKRLLQNAERTENADLLASAASIQSRVEDRELEVDTGAGERTNTVLALTDVGVSLEDAAQLVIDRVPDEATAKARRDRFPDEFAAFAEDGGVRDWLRDQGVASGAFLGLFGETAAISDRVAQDVEGAVRAHYLLYGDKEVAEKAAAKRLSRTYGHSTVGGQLRLQRHPPERYFPTVGGTDQALALSREERGEILSGVLERAVTTSGAEIPDAPGGLETPRFVTHADSRTERDLASGIPPSYEVRVRNNTGNLVPLRVDGEVVRMTVPTINELQELPEYQAIVQRRRGQANRPGPRRPGDGSVPLPGEGTTAQPHPFLQE